MREACSAMRPHLDLRWTIECALPITSSILDAHQQSTPKRKYWRREVKEQQPQHQPPPMEARGDSAWLALLQKAQSGQATELAPAQPERHAVAPPPRLFPSVPHGAGPGA